MFMYELPQWLSLAFGLRLTVSNLIPVYFCDIFFSGFLPTFYYYVITPLSYVVSSECVHIIVHVTLLQ